MPTPPFRLAVVTGAHTDGLSEGGERIAAALDERGVTVEPERWDDPAVDWDAYDAVLFRSCWEYPEDPSRFRTLLDDLEASAAAVANPLAAVRWNAHKSYLLDLEAAGVAIPPTRFVPADSSVALDSLLREAGWGEAIVKPAVGAMSADVWRTNPDAAADAADRFRALVADGDVIVQQFLPEIHDGERSIVYLGGEYSHAWNSLPASDDVTTFDGIDADYEPDSRVQRRASAALAATRDALDLDPADLPYARVDYVERDGDPVVLELELIEPFLGLERGAGATARFRDTLLAYYEGR